MTRSTGFRSSDIRPGMDVFSLDGVQIGTVIQTLSGPETPGSNGSNLHDPGAPICRRFDGESTGPAPTRDVGNFGPATQSPETGYATGAEYGDPLGNGEMLVGTLFGRFRRRRISLDEVQTISMERVVLRQRASAYQ